MKVFFYTSGCRVNQYETQYLREAICGNCAFEITENIGEADIAVINSCTVTHGADADCRQVMRRIMRGNPGCRTIITGCYAAASKDKIKEICPGAEVLPDKDDVIKAIKNGDSSMPRLITRFEGHSKAFIKIQDGCDAFCSYCIVPHVRNRLYSRPAAEIIEEAGKLVKNNYSEIVLCGIRLGKYALPGLSELIKMLTDRFHGLRIGLSSIEIGDISDGLALTIASSPNVLKKLHIPLQSGDDKILRLMNRPYTSEEFLKKINHLRKLIPGLSVTTDVIVGFPGETPANFSNTESLMKKCGFSGAHIFRFSPRQGTAAEKMFIKTGPAAGSQELKRRSVTLKKTLTR